MFLNNYIPDPVAFTLYGISINWYGILIAAGMLLGTIVMCRRAPKYEITSGKVLDVLIVCIPAGIVGARLYYVGFNWGNYSDDLMKIINLRLGGLAIHGGLIFAFIAALILCNIWRIRPLNLFDLAVPSIALAQAIGRWGNYFNSEAHGGPTDLPWAIPVNGQMVHPTFLYESIWCFLLFLILIFIGNRRQFYGEVFLLYGMLYSLERFFVEFLRTDSLMIGMLKQAQVLSASCLVICLIVYIVLYKKSRNKVRIFY